MKTLKTLAAWAVIMSAVAAGCTPITPDPPYQGGEGEEIVGKAPVITMSTPTTVIYDASLNGTATINFKALGATDIEIDADFNVKTELVELDDYKWQINLSEASDMEDRKEYLVTIKAWNEYGMSKEYAVVMKAYLANPFETDSYEVDADGKQYFFDTEGNVAYEWIIVEGEGAEGMCQTTEDPASLSFFVTRNTSLEVREVILTLKDKVGAFEYSATFSQLGRDMGEDEILAKERAAMLALNEALNMGYDVNIPHAEWGCVSVNSKGYVTNFMRKNVSGYLPEEIGDLKYCWEFILSGKITGELPKRIGEMSKLNSFSVYADEGYGLEGNLEESSLKDIIHQFKLLRLDTHNFTGGFPEWIGDSPDYCFYHLHHNRLEGKIPEKVQNHPRWNYMCVDGSGLLWKEKQMVQQEGYILYE